MKYIISILFSVLLLNIFCVYSNCKIKPPSGDSCLKVTCLNPRDTVSEKEKVIKTYFLVESLGDTIRWIDVYSSCGCEYPTFKRDAVIYPNHPDTIMITSSLPGHRGLWQKGHTIRTIKCTTAFNTGIWFVKE